MLKGTVISSFYHPSSIVLVDSDREFLFKMKRSLETEHCVSFVNPHKALDYVNFQFQHYTKFCKLGTPNQNVLSIINSAHRFTNISIIGTELLLEGMHGIDLLSLVPDGKTKKFLITDDARPKQAIHALNCGLTDYYLEKGVEEFYTRLKSVCHMLKNRYFKEMSAEVYSGFQAEPFCLNEDFEDEFEMLCDEQNICEYYFVTNPYGFLLVREDGNISRLVVQRNSDIAQTIDFLKQKDAPKTCIDKIASREFLPVFNSLDGSFSEALFKEWEKHIYPTKKMSKFLTSHILNYSTTQASYKEFAVIESNQTH